MNYNDILKEKKSHLKFQIQTQAHFLFLLRSMCLCVVVAGVVDKDNTADHQTQTLCSRIYSPPKAMYFWGSKLQSQPKMNHDPSKPITAVLFSLTLTDLGKGL